jgi:hypothetical protein
VEKLLDNIGPEYFAAAASSSPGGGSGGLKGYGNQAADGGHSNIKEDRFERETIDKYISKVGKLEDVIEDLRYQNSLLRSKLSKRDSEFDQLVEESRNRNFEIVDLQHKLQLSQSSESILSSEVENLKARLKAREIRIDNLTQSRGARALGYLYGSPSPLESDNYSFLDRGDPFLGGGTGGGKPYDGRNEADNLRRDVEKLKSDMSTKTNKIILLEDELNYMRKQSMFGNSDSTSTPFGGNQSAHDNNYFTNPGKWYCTRVMWPYTLTYDLHSRDGAFFSFPSIGEFLLI